MKINEYNMMMRHLTRPKDNLSVKEKKKILDSHYKYEPWANKKVERLNTGGAVAPVAEAKPMPILDYISTVNRLYGNGGAVDPDKDPKYIDPKEMDAIKKELQVSPMVKKPKKQIIKKTLIVEKPKPTPPIINFLELEDWLNEIDPDTWTEEESKKEVLLRVPRHELKGLASLLNVG